MKKIKRILSFAAAAVCFAGAVKFDEYTMEAVAADTLVFDFSEIEKNPQYQFYYSDQDEFFIDGIKVLYNNNEVTENTVFKFYTTPKSTYNGKGIDYTIPFIAEYDGKAAEGQLDVKIGMRGDVNCDNKITANDLVIIQNDLLQTYTAGKSALTVNDGFGIFLGNVDGRQSDKIASKQYGNNSFNIGDAYFVSSYLNGKGNKSMYNNILLNNAIKVDGGEIHVSECVGKSGEIVTVPVSQITKNGLGAFDITCKWDDSKLVPVGVEAANSDISLHSAIMKDSIKIWGFGTKDALKNGDIFNLKFKIPDDALNNTEYNIYVSNVDYFGTGSDASNYVYTYDGKITVRGLEENPPLIKPEIADNISYDYGVKAWDTSVEYGDVSAEIPVMLLGGLETKNLKMTVQCDSPLSVKTLENAVSVTENSKDGLVGIYDSDSNLNIDFETLKLAIDKNAKPGKYNVYISIEDVEFSDENTRLAVFNGSVTVRDKSVLLGDANSDGTLNVRDCALIASKLSANKTADLPKQSDFNNDNMINVRDAAAIAKKLAG